MFDITLITMGKLKEKFYTAAAAEYEKRLQGYCKFQLLELPEHRLPDSPSQAEIKAGLEKEADLMHRLMENYIQLAQKLEKIKMVQLHCMLNGH